MQLQRVIRALFGSSGSDNMSHAVLGTPLAVPDGVAAPLESATFGLGWFVDVSFSLCTAHSRFHIADNSDSFWGAERNFWNTKGVASTSVGYAGGSTTNPTYSEVCSGRSGHAEVR